MLAAGAFLLLLLWQLISSFGETSFLFPPPSQVITVFFAMLLSGNSWLAILTSTQRIVLSVVLAIFLAVIVSWLAAKHRSLRLLLAPLVLVLKAVPVVSFILIALFFMKDALLTSFICGTIVFPLVYTQLLSAYLGVDKDLLEMGRVFSLSKSEIIRYIVVPSCRETFLASVSVAVGMAWKAGVAAEVIAYANGTIGRQMHQAKLYLDMEGLLAWTLVLVLAAFISEHILLLVFRIVLTNIAERLPADGKPTKAFAKTISREVKTRSELLKGTKITNAASSAEDQAICPFAEQAVIILGELLAKEDNNGKVVPTIEIKNLCKCFEDSHVFNDLNISIPLNHPLVLIGSSGAGKTTLMRLIAGLTEPDSGTIEGVPERGVFVFQDNRLLPQLSVRDNIRLVLPCYDGDRADHLLDKLGLSSVRNQKAATLSGGEKRRLALARALAPESEILYLDEAFRELDEKHESKALQLMTELSKDKIVILATHDLTYIDRLQANVIELKKH